LLLLYRGPLASCNYDCPYCPFAKRRDSRQQLLADQQALARFETWVTENPNGDALSVLFTPWGEALTRSWYRQTLTRLSRLDHIERVAVQTNLGCRLGWLRQAAPDRVALWATYHPGQVSRERFLAACATLRGYGVRHSVGMVGLPEHHTEAVAVRAALPADTYLWINAADGHRYDPRAEAAWTAIDPLFGLSARPHRSAGHGCWAGESAVSVAGDGTVRRCHFLPEPIGNLYDGSFRPALGPRPCTRAECDCHIGYVHLKRLGLHQIFAGGVAERIPAGWPPVGRPMATPRGSGTAAPLWGVPPVRSGAVAGTPRR
jgi:hypothetical protein